MVLKTPIALAPATGLPTGIGATDIQRAYRLPVARGGDQTVAIVEVYDTPRLEKFLNTYRSMYHLGTRATSNGCLRKVNQKGQSAPLPVPGVRSGTRIGRDLDQRWPFPAKRNVHPTWPFV